MIKPKLLRIIFFVAIGSLCLHFFCCDASNYKDAKTTECNQTSRVELAACEKKEELIKTLSEKNITWDHVHIFLRAFKKEEELQIWVKNDFDTKFQKLITYPFCQSSGVLGPKRREGDRQIPEGFYHINRFNPTSKFFLSLGLDYPNVSDRKRGHQEHPGSDIFIHGKCVTVGCIPITDDKIKALYILALKAKENGQNKIPVHIFPTQLSTENLIKLANRFSEYKAFWEELQPIYEAFEERQELVAWFVDEEGRYLLK